MTGRRVPSALRKAAAVLATAAVFSCGEPTAAPAPPELEQLRSFALAAPLRSGGSYLLVGRWEVLRHRYEGAESSAGLEAAEPGAGPGAGDRTRGARPATWMTRQEARDWAAARGCRLPRLEEWRHLAGSGLAGTRLPTVTANTLELGMHRALPAGVFERGKTAEGCFDFTGNVWEWVDDEAPNPLGLAPRAQACGGSFASWARSGSAGAEHAGPDAVRLLEAEERADDLGFRVVADASDWLEQWVLPLWQRSPRWRDEVRACFRSWRPPLRGQLANRLRSRGLDEAFCQAVGGGA